MQRRRNNSPGVIVQGFLRRIYFRSLARRLRLRVAILGAGAVPVKQLKVVAVLLCAALAGFLPARASTVQAVFSGTVTSGFGAGGVCQAGQQCGIFSSIYPGQPYSVTYLFDTNLGTHFPSPEEIVGSDPQSPSLGAIVNIEGQIFNIGGSNFGDLGFGSASGGGRSFGAIAKDVYLPVGRGSAEITQSITNFTNALPTSLSGPFSYSVQPGDFGSGTLRIQDFNIQTNSGWLNDISFIIDSVAYSGEVNPTPVPGAALSLRHIAR